MSKPRKPPRSTSVHARLTLRALEVEVTYSEADGAAAAARIRAQRPRTLFEILDCLAGDPEPPPPLGEHDHGKR